MKNGWPGAFHNNVSSKKPKFSAKKEKFAGVTNSKIFSNFFVLCAHDTITEYAKFLLFFVSLINTEQNRVNF